MSLYLCFLCLSAEQLIKCSAALVFPFRPAVRACAQNEAGRRTGRGKRHGFAQIMLVILINNIVFRYKSISIHPNSVKPPLHRETTAFYSCSGLSPVRENTLCVRRACAREQLVSQFPAFVVGVLCKVCLCCQHCGCRHGRGGRHGCAGHHRLPARVLTQAPMRGLRRRRAPCTTGARGRCAHVNCGLRRSAAGVLGILRLLG